MKLNWICGTLFAVVLNIPAAGNAGSCMKAAGIMRITIGTTDMTAITNQGW